MVLSAYFQPNESEDIRAAQLSWWCDALQDWTVEQVTWALRKWNMDNPDRRPTPGHIVAVCKAARGAKYARELAEAKKPPEPPKKRPSAERANEILAEAGFRVRRMDDDTTS